MRHETSNQYIQPLPLRSRMGYEGPDEDGDPCECGVDLEAAEAGNPVPCAACDDSICEACADEGMCHHEGCEHVYCSECAPKWLPADGAGCCVPCVVGWHQKQIEGILGAMFA